jgi:hypothetical protein
MTPYDQHHVCFPPDIIQCQSLSRGKSARKELMLLRHAHRVKNATAIQSRWRAFSESRRFATIISKVVIVQSIFHRMVAQRYLGCHKKAATKISATWRSYTGKTVYQQIIFGACYKTLETGCVHELLTFDLLQLSLNANQLPDAS